jgi:predicted transcriptional regulator YheO
VIFRDRTGKPFAALCVNCDLSIYREAHELLTRLLSPAAPTAPRSEPAANSVDAVMREIIDEAVRQVGKPASAMDKADNTRALAIMVERGLFLVKGGAEHAARALRVSRYTVYNYLDAIRREA